LSIYSQASLPALETVGGYLYIYSQASLPALETVGGYLYINSQASLPALETVGGHLYINSQASLKADALIKGKKVDIKSKVMTAFTSRGYLLSDKILSKIISKKKAGKIVLWKTLKIGTQKILYVAQKGEMFSHGETVKKAVHDLRYKLTDRDTAKYNGWTLSSVHDIASIIGCYRAVTGACEAGTKGFCKGKDLPAKMSVKEAIEKTKGEYGNNEFAKFFKK
jgi:hypothetical protein